MWLLVAAPSLAGGYFFSDSGIEALGRAGAWVAGADTQYAQRYNPAGLTRIDRPTFNLGLSEVQQNVRFSRLLEDGTFAEEVRNEASPFDVPQAGFAMPLPEGFAFAFGFSSPFAALSRYPVDGAQRYSVVETGIYEFTVGPSVAWRPNPAPWLAVGLTFEWNYLQVNESLAITVNGGDDPIGDIDVSARVTDSFSPMVGGGLLIEPVDALSIGLAVQPPVQFKARGHGTLDFTGVSFDDGLEETVYTDDDVALAIGLPLELRAGVAVRPIDVLELEFAAVYQGWSSLTAIEITDVNIEVEVKDSPIWEVLIPEDQRAVADSFSLPAGLNDTISLRLGGEIDVTPDVALRAGGSWESASVPPAKMSVTLVDPPKTQVAAGGSGWLGKRRLRIDLAGAWLFYPHLEIRDSEVVQVDAGVTPGVEPMVVGNGDLDSHGWIVGGQVSVALGKAP